MASYVVMTPPGGDPTGERTRFIRDGFAFLALVLPVVWFLWHRLWLWALGFVAIALLVNVLTGIGGWFWTGIAVSICSAVFAALEGQALRIRKLEAQGWTAAAVIGADDMATAEAIYFAAAQPTATAPPPPPAGQPVQEPDERPWNRALTRIKPKSRPSDRANRRPGEGETGAPRRADDETFGLFEWNGAR